MVFGGKTGLFAFEARAVVDATVDATVARAAGARFTPVAGPRRFNYIADLAKPVSARALTYRAANGVEARVAVHHYYAEFELTLDSRATGPFALADDYERIYAATLECPWQGAEKRFRGADGCLTSGWDRLELAGAGRAAGLDSLLVFGPHGVAGNVEGSLVLKSTRALFTAFPDALAQVRAGLRSIPSPRPRYEFWNRALAAETTEPAGAVHSFVDHGFAEPGTATALVRFQAPRATLTTPVLVAGGGTSGNAAAYASAGLGLSTVCLERGLELGGTNTVGGVTKLWFGNETRAFADYYRAMGAKNDGINAPGFFRGVRQAGARVLFQTAVTGVMRVGRDVRRVYVLTPLGLAAIDATHVIDATGDGALAAWAGCGYTFGGEHDELTLWASYAGYRPGVQEALRCWPI